MRISNYEPQAAGRLGGLGLALPKVRWFEETITAHQEAAELLLETGDRYLEGVAPRNLEADQTAQAAVSAS
jgi:hypothetical protein